MPGRSAFELGPFVAIIYSEESMWGKFVSFILFAMALAAMGCTRVLPYQRGDLARKCMQSPFSRHELRNDYDNKVQQTATAAELPGGTPGGGCGCTQ